MRQRDSFVRRHKDNRTNSR
ncbi:hypothetical protein HU200_011558 [Digitaria exilis]|uniref:Uncharacterized protein n=1 Tax=Digitaria exilis TaxID=1010633 RepID=A0A835ARL6_9POAL|nr:hypothetical protein HU200_053658 [Digitaria exilis]KAF8754002.1 hypothetical protein HU200_011558 [Digitaria exilis]